MKNTLQDLNNYLFEAIERLEDDNLTEEILRLKDDPDTLARMAEASRRCGPDKATEIIVDKVLEEVTID